MKLTMSTYYLIRSLRQFIQSVNLLNCSDMDIILVACFIHMVHSELGCYERVSPIDISDPIRVGCVVFFVFFLFFLFCHLFLYNLLIPIVSSKRLFSTNLLSSCTIVYIHSFT
ncbi:unnamed protein product [Trichobilharzia regenti]|nr:unnamed protein product [Trichobilharzia regenti]